MAERRVAITGIGVVTPLAIGAQAFWDALLAAKSAARKVDLFDASGFAGGIGAQLDDFSARSYVPKDYRKAVKVMARDIEIAVAAADLAFRDSGLVTRGIDPAAVTIDPRRTGANIGAGLICSDLDELGVAVSSAITDGKFDLKLWGEVGMTNLTPLWMLKYLPNMLACHVTIIHGAEGPSNTITCGDASGLLAVAEAARYIQRGAADVVIAGGAETKLNPMGMLRQGLLGRLAPCADCQPAEACRPFDATARGTVVGEGGGLLILEDMERAQARGARIYAELAGFGAACDPQAIDITAHTAGRLDLAVTKALADAGIAAGDLGLIVANGPRVPGEDACETECWRDALGEAAAAVPAVALTGATGSLAAGSGGVQIAAAAMALANQVVPPTVNFRSAPAGGLNLSSQQRQCEMQYAAVGGFTIGGQSAACILKRYSA